MDREITNIRDKVFKGERINEEEALYLYKSNDLLQIGEMANYINERKNGKKVYFVINRHINYTNICINRCKFCAFSVDKEDPRGYTLSIDEILKKAEKSVGIDIKEFHIVGGLHPELPFSYYLNMLRRLKERFPNIHIQGYTAVEIDHFSKISGLPIDKVLIMLKEAGLGSIPGGGAEIFDEGIREDICSKKISGNRWLEIMEKAHRLGFRSNATMLYGHKEDYKARIDHLSRIRKLQDKTGGFQSFIPLAFHPQNTKIEKRRMTTGFDDLKTLAISRIFLDNFEHIKAFWIMLGENVAQVSLSFGVDDIDGTVVEERITHSAGATTSEYLPKEEIINMIKKVSKIPVERDTLYNFIREW
jgi:aminodeoxyfutalosine synthase